METNQLFKDVIIPILTLFVSLANIFIIFRALKIQTDSHKIDLQKHFVETHREKINNWPDLDLDIIADYVGSDETDDIKNHYGEHLCKLKIKVLKNNIRVTNIDTRQCDNFSRIISIPDEDFKGRIITQGNEVIYTIGKYSDAEACDGLWKPYIFKCEVIYDDVVGNSYSKTVIYSYKHKVVQQKEIEMNSIS